MTAHITLPSKNIVNLFVGTAADAQKDGCLLYTSGMKADGLEVTYLRLKRSIQASEETGLRFFDSNEACAEALKEIKGNILLTTGSKELSAYTASEEVKKRL